jgi:hypothetical protein
VTNEDCSLDSFEMAIGTSELTKNFWHYQGNVKDSKCPLEWWKKHGTMFFVIAFLTWKIHDIVGSRIEIKIIFSLIGRTNLKRRHADCSWIIYFCEKKLAQWSYGK